MNKKGFTLVELLAVVVILALLALLTSTAVTKLVKDAKKDLSETQMTLIKSAADTWIADNLNSLPSSGTCGYLTLEDLKYYGLLDNTILDPKNSEEISNDLKIKITTTTSAYGNPVTTAEVNPESIEGCSQIYFPICTIAADSTVTGLNAGAKYNCKVDPNKDEYIFYVLTSATANATTVNMIMDSNIKKDGTPLKEYASLDQMEQSGIVPWISKVDYISEEVGGSKDYWDLVDDSVGKFQGANDKGPISAMNFLAEATASWTNVNTQTIGTFTDTTGASHKMAKTYTINARMPYYSEISNISESTPWLLENLYAGYWILSSGVVTSDSAWFVYTDGSAYGDGIISIYNTTDNGVRPVINVPVKRIIQTNQ